MIKALAILLLISSVLAARSLSKSKAMTKQYETCSEGCLTCIKDGSSYCFYCDEGYIWNTDGKTCKPYVDRDFPGVFRDCVECPKWTAVSQAYSCIPCAYGCIKCLDDEYGTCLECDTSIGYRLNENGECTCDPGRLNSNGICYCQEFGYYIDPETLECKKCDFTTRKYPNCPKECPVGYYDMNGVNCGLCDPSCKTCVGPAESQCNECSAKFEKVTLAIYNPPKKLCMCKCGAIESSFRQCTCTDPQLTMNSNGVCQ